MAKVNLDKIKKEMDKCEEEKLPDLVLEIQQYANEKLLAKSQEHSNNAEKYRSLSNSILKPLI